MGAALTWLPPALLAAAARASPMGLSAGRPAAYSHASQAVANNPSWMAGLPDAARLSELSLPGTHDTMALLGGDIAQTQSMGLSDQLASGVRAIDIRCLHTFNSCAVHHGIVDQRASLWDVLAALRDFLDRHPSEAVLMRLGQTPGKGNNRSFDETWTSHRAAIDATRAKGGPLVWPSAGAGAEGCWTAGIPGATDRNPTLGEVRGKVVLLQDFGMSWRGCHGIPYPAAFDIQDRWELSSNWALYAKWEAARDQLDRASRGPRSSFFMNYLSASTGSFPYFVASGQTGPSTDAPRLATGRTAPARGGGVWPDFPRVACAAGTCSIAFEGTNVLAARWLRGRRARVGVVMADFPGPDLLSAVILQNWNASEGGGQSPAGPEALLV